MTIAARQRLADHTRVLKVLASELGDRGTFDVSWDVTLPAFTGVISTTWDELVERGLLRRHKRLNPPPAYELTDRGWAIGLALNGALEEGPVRERCITLVKYFKTAVDGRDRHGDAILLLDPLRDRFPLPWVLNVLRSSLLQHMFPDKRMNANWDEIQKCVRVPVTFGMPND